MTKHPNTPLNIPETKSGEWEVKHLISPAGERWKTANYRCQLFGDQKSDIVSWPHDTTFHMLLQNGGRWMSDWPCEQAQMRECAKTLYGDVLVGGLGLGLIVHTLAEMPEVYSIVIVEREPDVISLVRPHLPNPSDKEVKVVQADLFDFLQDCDGFDTAFYDIWASDGEDTFFNTVCPLLRLSQYSIVERPVCWNEDVMRGQLKMSLQNRWMFCRVDVREHLKVTANYPTLDDLCTPGDSIWEQWYCDFFAWVKKSSPNEEDINLGMDVYCSWYGLPNYLAMWEQFIANPENMFRRVQ